MPGARPKKEGMRERNDSLIIVKADGGLVEANDVYQEFGELHSDKDGATINLQHKIPVYHPTVLGRPPIQDRMIYYVDEEPQDCGFDPFYMFGKLKSVYNLTATDNTHDSDTDRKHKRNMDMIFTIFGGFLLVFAFFIAPMIGFSLKTSGETVTPAPAEQRNNSFPTPTPPSGSPTSMKIEGGFNNPMNLEMAWNSGAPTNPFDWETR